LSEDLVPVRVPLPGDWIDPLVPEVEILLHDFLQSVMVDIDVVVVQQLFLNTRNRTHHVFGFKDFLHS
jgi:hypothetical protein